MVVTLNALKLSSWGRIDKALKMFPVILSHPEISKCRRLGSFASNGAISFVMSTVSTEDGPLIVEFVSPM